MAMGASIHVHVYAYQKHDARDYTPQPDACLFSTDLSIAKPQRLLGDWRLGLRLAARLETRVDLGEQLRGGGGERTGQSHHITLKPRRNLES